MKLIIAEKPSVARDIAATLGKVTRKTGYLEAGDYTVTYAIGHLVGLADADAYDSRFKSWRLQDLPIVPEHFSLVVLPHAKSQYQIVAELLSRAKEVIVATDAGREGQLIYELIARHAHYRGTAKRLWLSSLTDQAIRDAFSHLLDNEVYQPLYEAAISRAEADWLVGINATRCMTVQAGVKLPVGRVQTPTLAMIVRRDLAIESFVATPYFEVIATFAVATDVYTGKWTRGKQSRLDDRSTAQAIATRVLGQAGQIQKVDKKPKSEQPPQLFDLTSLQRRANQLWGMTAEQTLKTAQALYETHKLLTYPRTDSRYISQDVVPTLPGRLKAAAAHVPDLSPLMEMASSRPGGRVVNDKKVTDHHAIIPTDKRPGSKLTSDERRLYELIARQTFAALMPVAQWSMTFIETVVAGERFMTSGRTLVRPGWRAALQDSAERVEPPGVDDDDPDQTGLPVLAQGQSVRTIKAEVLDKHTKPPAHFTEASLLAAMESAGRQIEDSEVAEAMKERGLGTPATRAATIEKLKRDGLIVTHKKQLTATVKARELIAAIPIPALTSPELTGEWELQLKQMEKSQYARQTFMQEIAAFTQTMIEQLTAQTTPFTAAARDTSRRTPTGSGRTAKVRASAPYKRTPVPEKPPANDGSVTSGPLGICPLCGAPIVQTAKAYGCSAWRTGCRFTVWKEIAGHVIEEQQVRDLLTKGSTGTLTFKSKTGKPFEAQLKLSQVGTTEFVFVHDRR